MRGRRDRGGRDPPHRDGRHHPELARASGFEGVVDLLKVAEHGRGENIYLVRFHYIGRALGAATAECGASRLLTYNANIRWHRPRNMTRSVEPARIRDGLRCRHHGLLVYGAHVHCGKHRRSVAAGVRRTRRRACRSSASYVDVKVPAKYWVDMTWQDGEWRPADAHPDAAPPRDAPRADQRRRLHVAGRASRASASGSRCEIASRDIRKVADRNEWRATYRAKILGACVPSGAIGRAIAVACSSSRAGAACLRRGPRTRSCTRRDGR